MLVHYDESMWIPAQDAGLVDRSLVAFTDPGDGADIQTVVARDVEVNDEAIACGGLDRAQVNVRLSELGILVRKAIEPA
jgi:hypothetical protein